MRSYLLLALSLATVSTVFAADAAPAAAPAPAPAPAAQMTFPPIVFPNYGFRINPLDAGTLYPVVPAMQMYLPAMSLPSNPKATFSPNVFVQVQPFVGSMKDYITQTTASMEAAGYIIRGQLSPSDNQWSLEYIAVLNGVAMHWYAKAILSGYRVYYAAGGAPDELWPRVADIIKSCVNSFDITGTAPEIKFTPSPAPVTAPPAGGPAAAPMPAAATAPAAKPATTTSTAKPMAPAAKSATGTSAK